MKLYTSIIIVIFLYSINLFGQQTKIDSLKVELANSKTEIKKIEALKNLNKVLFGQAPPEESIQYFKQMLSLSIKLKDYELEAESYKYISEYYMNKNDFKNAKNTCIKAINLCKEQKLHEDAIISINQLARVFHHFQKYETAIKYYDDGIKYYKKYPVGKTICIIYSNRGSALGLIGKPIEEIKSYLKGMEIAEQINYNEFKYSALTNLGWSYMSIEQYEKAEKYLLKGLKDSLKIKNERDKISLQQVLALNYSRWGKLEKALKLNKIVLGHFIRTGDKLFELDITNSIAVIYRKMKLPLKTIEYSIKAIKIGEEINSKIGILVTTNTLGSAYLDIHQYNKAEELFLKISKDTINPELIDLKFKSTIYDNLAAIYEGKKEYKKSLKYYKRFKELNDSILIEKRDSKVTEIETKYQTEKKEAENLQLKTEKATQQILLEKERTRKWLLGGGMGVSLITLVVFGYYYQRNKKQKELIENLQKELHHRVKNNLSIIDTFIEVAKDEFPESQFQLKLTELQNRIASINQIHKQLYVNKNITSLNLNNYISSLATNIQHSFSNNNILINQNIHKNIEIEVSKSFPIGLIVNEFITNSYKYAFDHSSNGIIDVSIIDDNKNYIISLKDNGKGLPKDFNLNEISTFGIRIMKLLTDQLNGTFQLSTYNGVQLTIEIAK